MADKTITQLTATTSAATADEIPIWVAGSAVTRKITKANFLQGAFTGGGTVATGGYTLTVPATGTAALLGTAQTFSALKTFSAGISLGNETLSAYDEGDWTPVLRFGGASTGITYSSLTATYTKIGNLVFVVADIRLSSKGSATGAADIAGLPFSSSGNPNGQFLIRWVSMAANYVIISGTLADASAAIGLYGLTAAAATLGTISDTAFGNTSILQISGCYRA